MRRIPTLFLLLVGACSSTADTVEQTPVGAQVSLCLGPNHSLVAEPDRNEKLAIELDGATEIRWSGGEPRIVASLGAGERHTLAVKWGDDVVESYDLATSGSKMITLYKSAGLWHLVHNAKPTCAFPFAGVEQGTSELRCFTSIGTTAAPCGT